MEIFASFFLALSIAVLVYVLLSGNDPYATFFYPKQTLNAFLKAMHEMYLKVPLYRSSYKKAEEAYMLLEIRKPAWQTSSTLWTTAFLLFLFAFLLSPVLFLPGAFLIFYLPTWANNKRAKYTRGIGQGLLEYIDLVSVSVTAGLPLSASLEEVAKSSDSSFFREMTKTMQKITTGSSLREELLILAQRNPTPELSAFAEQISSLYDSGGENAPQVLRDIASHLREMYVVRLEREVERMQVKMVAPLFVSVLGTLILIGGPIVLYVSQFISSTGGGFF